MTQAAVTERVRSLLDRYADTWLGRVVSDSVRGLVNIELFDRSMTLAAQAFTSVFPVLILVATLRPRSDDSPVGSTLADSLGLSPQAREALQNAVPQNTDVSAAFGLVGVLVVVLSATSYSRALLRMYVRVWDAPRPPGLRSMWRWIATLLGVVVLVLLLTLIRRVVSDVPLSGAVEAFLAFVLAGFFWTWVPWFLLARRIPVRMLVPGGALMALCMMLLEVAGQIYLPIALSSGIRRFGVLGISFTYVTWLFVVMFALVVSTTVGAVIAREPGPLSRALRIGRRPEPRPPA